MRTQLESIFLTQIGKIALAKLKKSEKNYFYLNSMISCV